MTNALKRARGRGVFEAIALQHLADTERRSGRLVEARAHYEEALPLAEEARYVDTRFGATAGLAAVHRALGEHERSVATAREAEAMIESMRENITAVAERSHLLHVRSDVYDPVTCDNGVR